MHVLRENIAIDRLSVIDTSDVITSKGFLFQISDAGFYIRLNRKNLSSRLRGHLSLHSVHNEDVVMHLPKLNIHLDGTVKHTKHLGQGVFEMLIQFFDHVPDYWSDCLLDMFQTYSNVDLSVHPV